MKKVKCLIIVFFYVLISSIKAQQNYFNSDLFPAFKEIAPSIKQINSGYPNPNELAKGDLYLSQNGDTCKFVAKVITSDSLKKIPLLKNAMYKEQPQNITDKSYRWKDDAQKVAVKYLIVYCDSFALNEMLWLPECNITIQSRVINMNKNELRATPLPWRKSLRFDMINEGDRGAGNPGCNGGNINITCENILNIGNINSNGSDGESIFMPEITIAQPEYKTQIELYKNYGCDDEGTGQSTTWDLISSGKPYYAVAGIFHNYNLRSIPLPNTECWGKHIYDNSGNIELQNPNPTSLYDNKLIDKKSMSRTSYEKTWLPGKGGNTGAISINKQNANVSLYPNVGKSGSFLARSNSEFITYGTLRQKISDVKFNPRTYWSVCADITSSYGGTITYSYEYNPASGKDWPWIYVPSNDEAAKVNNDLRNATTNNDGKKNPFSVNTKTYTPHLEYLQRRFLYLQNQYVLYFKKSDSERKAFDWEVKRLIADLKTISNDTNKTAIEKLNYSSLYLQASDWSNNTNRNVDEFNNQAGFRPLLSLKTTMSYIKNNLKTDLKLYIYGDMMAGNETKAKIFLDSLPNMMNGLKDKNNELANALADENKVYDDLMVQADTLQKKTDEIKADLKKIEADLMEEAKKDEKRQQIIKATMKIAAVAASVIPYGQPILGEVVGNGLNAIADGIGRVHTKFTNF